MAVVATFSLLAACGGGGTVPEPGVQARALSSEFTTRNAVNYAPFREEVRDPSKITDAMVKQDLELLAAANLKLIRIFDSSDEVARRALRVIRDNGLDIKVQLGVWIQSGQETANLAEMDRGVALAKEFPSTVLAVSVGNETMVTWSFNPVKPADMARYIQSVRDRITQPVTTNDNWAFWAGAPASILDVVDYVAMHTYPLADTVHSPGAWDWRQESVAASVRASAMMDAALARSKADYAAVRTYLDGLGRKSKAIVIGETGWKAVPSGGEAQRAHPVNQKMMFDRLNAWVSQARAGGDGPKAIFWFAAFDEPWKGSDDKWGLFNMLRQARLALQSVIPAAQREPGAWTPADAVYYVPVVAGGPVSASRYAVLADQVVAGEARPSEAVAWNAWENGTTAMAADNIATADMVDGGKSIEITPKPAAWGWGMTLGLPTRAEDLSQFNVATGRLNFSIRTTYPGKIEVGFLTGTAAGSSLYDVYLPIASGQYGYVNDGQWRQVSIPLADIIAKGAMAFGMTDPTKSRLDMTKVTNLFVVADRYVVTGKSQGTNDQTKILVDAIYWSR
ncbi:MAG: hypothetical protein WCT47_13155 [Betaproteobacteria bacterium]|jgi:exo-beta-1,3-glucanase (GH17 family)